MIEQMKHFTKNNQNLQNVKFTPPLSSVNFTPIGYIPPSLTEGFYYDALRKGFLFFDGKEIFTQ